MSAATRPNLAGTAGYESEIDGRTDRDEEQAKQKPLERLDVALQLVAILAAGQDDTGDEGPEGGADTHLRHQYGG